MGVLVMFWLSNSRMFRFITAFFLFAAIIQLPSHSNSKSGDNSAQTKKKSRASGSHHELSETSNANTLSITHPDYFSVRGPGKASDAPKASYKKHLTVVLYSVTSHLLTGVINS